MHRSRLLQLVTLVGRELVLRGMRDHAKVMRLYYLAVHYGLTSGKHAVDLRWDEDFIVEWARLLGLPPHATDYQVRPRHSKCARCPDERDSIRTEVVFVGGAKFRCVNCGAVWVERSLLFGRG